MKNQQFGAVRTSGMLHPVGPFNKLWGEEVLDDSINDKTRRVPYVIVYGQHSIH